MVFAVHQKGKHKLCAKTFLSNNPSIFTLTNNCGEGYYLHFTTLV